VSCAWLGTVPTVKSSREIAAGSPRNARGSAISTKPSPWANLYPLYANSPPTEEPVRSAGAPHALVAGFHAYTVAAGIVSLRSYRPGGWSPLCSMYTVNSGACPAWGTM